MKEKHDKIMERNFGETLADRIMEEYESGIWFADGYVFLTTPIKFNGRVLQYLGRVLRPAAGKDKAKVYDYVDLKVGVLRASAKARQRVFSQ